MGSSRKRHAGEMPSSLAVKTISTVVAIVLDETRELREFFYHDILLELYFMA